MANQEQAGALTKAFESGKFIRKNQVNLEITSQKVGLLMSNQIVTISMFLMHAHGLIEHLSHERFLV